MKEINNYYKSYNESKKRIDFLKYGLFNERGINIDSNLKYYNEEDIIKPKYNGKNNKDLRW